MSAALTSDIAKNTYNGRNSNEKACDYDAGSAVYYLYGHGLF